MIDYSFPVIGELNMAYLVVNYTFYAFKVLEANCWNLHIAKWKPNTKTLCGYLKGYYTPKTKSL